MELIQDDEENNSRKPKIPVSLYISEGRKHIRLCQYENAILSFDNVLNRDPHNIKSLLGRCKCFIRLGKFQEAQMDVEQVLKINPKCSEAISMKSEIEFAKGDFETSFRTCRRGQTVRPACSLFKLRSQFCEKTLDNSLRGDKPLTLEKLDINEIMKILVSEDLPANKRGDTHSIKKRMSSIDAELVQMFLSDKDFISVHPLCKDLLEFLIQRNCFWRAFMPNVSKKWPSTTKKEDLRMDDPEHFCELKGRRCNQCEDALKEDIENLLEMNLEDEIPFDKDDEDHHGLRKKAKGEILSIIGLACMLEKGTFSALGFQKRAFKLGNKYNMPWLKKNALRYIAENYIAIEEYENACLCLRRCIDLTESDIETSIILYKIAECKSQVNKLVSAGKVAQKALDLATSNYENRLRVDITMLLAEISIRNGNLSTADYLYEKALSIASQTNDDRQEAVKDLIKLIKERTDNDRCRENFLRLPEIVRLNEHFKCKNNLKHLSGK
ncbi:uncharacterized protein LOC118202743 [Stegodyphus dumicola]|uniref:uncharacterized protein LOC118202743 n=1 Tax=Stegodyphus dumicola TaxID=202533 RepID=UPI0015AE097B|nr:uncharacterized protein LOC118202743 [Stegodyphus dumicola]XP_035230830.1 uncharacterized protein LOC118202743 [Stegodyphus dumicola]